MGMYTGLRCKCIVKEEFRPLIAKMMKENLDWKDIAEGYGFIDEFSKGFRADFIPYGSLCYMPDEWEDENRKAKDGFNRQFNEETGYWAFQCSLKNYESDIEKFFDLILNNIAERIIHLEKYYEEWIYSEKYDFVNGKIECVNPNFIKYQEDHSDDYWKGFGGY
jgi:hypothetical protein